MNGRKPIVVTEIAAILGVTDSAVRHIIRRDNITPAARYGRANAYWFDDVRHAVGVHDRRVIRKRRTLVSHLSGRSRMP